ncbi:transcriptional regulator [Amorphoplanes nipponensis]|uniref:Transcriptional regulator n=2 Tax=Actinoplanes nipponensis TaxID=135950 RepID=A0A919JDI0_9ACTN|nr:helix-turn-helix transcriptional regulator [Actinoplanes nipponensis]GIE49004.1 transcriptional regulator [Actinoplanes nipponensis]
MTSAEPDYGSGSTALRIQLGVRLRRLRQARGISRETAGWEIRGSESKISRMELGRVPFKERDVADLLALYGVGEPESTALLNLARRANAPAWWRQFGEVVPPWYLSYLGLEEAASLIRSYEAHFVPSLLQTPDYARAVLRRAHAAASAAEIERRIELRRNRQRVLTRPDPPQFWAVLDEAVLRREIGGREVMRAQVRALLEAAELPHVRLQVARFHQGTAAPAGFPFAIMRFAEPELSDVVYVEQLTGALYLDKPADVEHYLIAMERACLEAEPPERTIEILGDALHQIAS